MRIFKSIPVIILLLSCLSCAELNKLRTIEQPKQPTVVFRAAKVELVNVEFEFTMPDKPQGNPAYEILKLLIGADLLKALAGHETTSDIPGIDTPF